jgi:hypothetical protein
MHFMKVGNGMIVWLQPLQDPLQFYIAVAFFFQLSAAANFIEVAIQLQFLKVPRVHMAGDLGFYEQCR